MSTETWKLQAIDGGLLAFDRRKGENILARNEHTVALERTAPRCLQVELLSQCNLSCNFCYRDKGAPARLTAEFLVDLLTKAADWGVLEVAFGGGEPLLFEGFVPLVRRLDEQTPLGINFTTNGTLLTSRVISELGDHVGEIRISAYADNHYRRTLNLLRDRPAGVNLLVTPANLRSIDVIVRDALRQGATNVLLLGYKGPDAGLHLSSAHLDQLRQAILRMQHLPLRVDICWYPLLPDVPHLFPRGDCGAGCEFLVITPDQAIMPCSFHEARIPFESFADVQRIYGELRSRRDGAALRGCTRQQFVPLAPSRCPTTTGIWFWHARSSNNSGDWTIVGRFRSTDLAQDTAEALRRLARAHEAFIASPEGQAWLQERDYCGSWPTPPLQQFGEAHGFSWSEEGDGLWWEEDGCGAPVLTAGAVGDAVVVYHPYCMGLPEEPFRKFFAAVGAKDFGYWQYDRPAVIATASGHHADAVAAIEHYLALVAAAEYPSDVEEPPPWGAECQDSRLLDDEDRSARLASGAHTIQPGADQLRLALTFENAFAGAIALERWLSELGYANVCLTVDCQAASPVAGEAAPIRPNQSLFPDVQPVTARIATLNNEELMAALFAYHSSAPAALEEAVARIPVDERLSLARRIWQTRRRPGADLDWRALMVMDRAGSPAAPWFREMWPLLLEEEYAAMGIALGTMAAVLPAEEAFSLAHAWLSASRDRSQYTERLKQFRLLKNPATVALIEKWWEECEPDTPVTGDWGLLAAASQVDWLTLRQWMNRGRPLSLLALDALAEYASTRVPPDYREPVRAEFTEILSACQATDPTPRTAAAVRRLVAAAHKLTHTDP